MLEEKACLEEEANLCRDILEGEQGGHPEPEWYVGPATELMFSLISLCQCK